MREVPKSSRTARPRKRRYCTPDRLVEPEQLVVPGDGLGGGALPQRGLRGSAGEGAQPGEQQDRQPQQDRDQLEEPPDDEAEHALRSTFPEPDATAPAAAGAAAGAVRRLDQSLRETVEKTSAVSGLGSRPCTFSATTSAGGECEIGTPGQVVHDQPVGLLVQLRPVRRVGLGVGLGQRGEDLRRAERTELRRAWSFDASAKNVPMKL